MTSPLLALAFALLPGASAATSGSRLVVVYAYAEGDAKLETAARLEAFNDSFPGLVKWKVASGYELAKKLEGLKKTAELVAKLHIDAHGAPGFSEALADFDLPFLSGLDAVFAPGAQIVFHSCSVAAGPEGRKFLEGLGAALLRKGGTVAAPLGPYFDPGYIRAVMPMLPGVSPKGYLVYRAGAGGKGKFDVVPAGPQEFVERVDVESRRKEALAKAVVRLQGAAAGWYVRPAGPGAVAVVDAATQDEERALGAVGSAERKGADLALAAAVKPVNESFRAGQALGRKSFVWIKTHLP